MNEMQTHEQTKKKLMETDKKGIEERETYSIERKEVLC